MSFTSSRFRIERLCQENISGSPKSSFHRKQTRPGQQAKSTRRKRVSEYAVQRNAIRVLAAFYGSDIGHKMRFRKILRYAREALATSRQNLIQGFIQNFELRLDTVIYRLKWAPTMRAARQMLIHGKCIKVDGKKVTRGHIKPGQTITISEDGMKSDKFAQGQATPHLEVPNYYQCSEGEAQMTHIPAFSEIPYPCKVSPGDVLKFCREFA